MPVECNCNTRLRVRSGFITADPNFYYRSFSFWFLWFLTTFVCVQLYKTKRERKRKKKKQKKQQFSLSSCSEMANLRHWFINGHFMLRCWRSASFIEIIWRINSFIYVAHRFNSIGFIDLICILKSTVCPRISKCFFYFLGVANGVDEGFLLRTTGFWNVLVVSCIQSGENLGTFGDS